MSKEVDISEELELCGFSTGTGQESRVMNLLGTILKLQTDPAIPLTFGEIYDQVQKEEPESKLTKAWVHRVIKSLVDAQLIRIENPAAHRKRYIADVNSVMAGLEQSKNMRITELETQKGGIDKQIDEISKIECGQLAQQFIKNVTGTQQKISSRIVKGVDELHRVLRYNMLDVAKKGDTIRATLLWIGPFMDEGVVERTQRFVEAAKRGADIRYLMSMDIMRLEEFTEQTFDMKNVMAFIQNLMELKQQGLKIDFRIYGGPRTYFQVSLNKENMALIITEDPMTATWITRDFNPDLIDNAIKTFDRDWKKARSLLEMTPEDFAALGASPDGLITRVFAPDEQG